MLTPECELWQSCAHCDSPVVGVLLTPECELWQSVCAD